MQGADEYHQVILTCGEQHVKVLTNTLSSSEPLDRASVDCHGEVERSLAWQAQLVTSTLKIAALETHLGYQMSPCHCFPTPVY